MSRPRLDHGGAQRVTGRILKLSNYMEFMPRVDKIMQNNAPGLPPDDIPPAIRSALSDAEMDVIAKKVVADLGPQIVSKVADAVVKKLTADFYQGVGEGAVQTAWKGIKMAGALMVALALIGIGLGIAWVARKGDAPWTP